MKYLVKALIIILNLAFIAVYFIIACIPVSYISNDNLAIFLFMFLNIFIFLFYYGVNRYAYRRYKEDALVNISFTIFILSALLVLFLFGFMLFLHIDEQRHPPWTF